jgi:hypothetical protein
LNSSFFSLTFISKYATIPYSSRIGKEVRDVLEIQRWLKRRRDERRDEGIQRNDSFLKKRGKEEKKNKSKKEVHKAVRTKPSRAERGSNAVSEENSGVFDLSLFSPSSYE